MDRKHDYEHKNSYEQSNDDESTREPSRDELFSPPVDEDGIVVLRLESLVAWRADAEPLPQEFHRGIRKQDLRPVPLSELSKPSLD